MKSIDLTKTKGLLINTDIHGNLLLYDTDWLGQQDLILVLNKDACLKLIDILQEHLTSNNLVNQNNEE